METAALYLITNLPTLGELGTAPTMSLSALIDQVAEVGDWSEQLAAVALMDDLLQRDSLVAGEIEEAHPAVLNDAQVRGEAPLPEPLEAAADEHQAAVIEADLLWERYFRYVHQLGQLHRSQFLCEWVEFEVSLRNALAVVRARNLGLKESGYLVATDLSVSSFDFTSMLSEWGAATTPLDGLQAVIRTRWAWVSQHEAWYSFRVDELLAYAVRVMLLEQWLRSTEREEQVA